MKTTNLDLSEALRHVARTAEKVAGELEGSDHSDTEGGFYGGIFWSVTTDGGLQIMMKIHPKEDGS